MKKLLITMMFGFALGSVAKPAIGQTTHVQREVFQDQVPQSKDVIAANQAPEKISNWTEPGSTTITVTSTPLEVRPSRKERWADHSSAKRPSKDEWTRCAQNENCRARNLYNNQWDWVFRPAYDFGN